MREEGMGSVEAQAFESTQFASGEAELRGNPLAPSLGDIGIIGIKSAKYFNKQLAQTVLE